jgi:hypothetical protein
MPERPPGIDALGPWVCFLLAPWRSVLDPTIPNRLTTLENRMAAFDAALADLDTQIDDLVAYVNSDDATDAAEVQSRADRIKAALAAARDGGTTPADPTG